MAVNAICDHKDIKAIINEAAQFAQDSPEPDAAELWTDVYAA